MAAPSRFSAGQRSALAHAGSRMSAKAVAGLAQEGKLPGPDGKRLAPFAVSDTTVRRAVADVREHAIPAPVPSERPGSMGSQDFEAKLLEHLAAEWRSYEDRRGDLKPAQRRSRAQGFGSPAADRCSDRGRCATGAPATGAR
jgi:hypothetical protein